MAVTQESATVCQKCGKLVGDSNFCPYCGEAVTQNDLPTEDLSPVSTPEETTSPPSKTVWQRLPLWAKILPFVLIVLIAFAPIIADSMNNISNSSPSSSLVETDIPSEATADIPSENDPEEVSFFLERDCPYGLVFNMTIDQFIERYNNALDAYLAETVSSADRQSWKDQFVADGVYLSKDKMTQDDDTWLQLTSPGFDIAFIIVTYDEKVSTCQVHVTESVSSGRNGLPARIASSAAILATVDSTQLLTSSRAKDVMTEWNAEFSKYSKIRNYHKNNQALLSQISGPWYYMGNVCYVPTSGGVHITAADDQHYTQFFNALEVPAPSATNPKTLAIKTLERFRPDSDPTHQITNKEILDDMFLSPNYTAIENPAHDIVVTVEGMYRRSPTDDYSQSGKLVFIAQNHRLKYYNSLCTIDFNVHKSYSDQYVSGKSTLSSSPEITAPGSSASSGLSLPYVIRATGEMPIYSGPGVNYDYVSSLSPSTYTIVEESGGQGAALWGKLKSGAGWIALDHVQLKDSGTDVLGTAENVPDTSNPGSSSTPIDTFTSEPLPSFSSPPSPSLSTPEPTPAQPTEKTTQPEENQTGYNEDVSFSQLWGNSSYAQKMWPGCTMNKVSEDDCVPASDRKAITPYDFTQLNQGSDFVRFEVLEKWSGNRTGRLVFSCSSKEWTGDTAKELYGELISMLRQTSANGFKDDNDTLMNDFANAYSRWASDTQFTLEIVVTYQPGKAAGLYFYFNGHG